MSRPLTPIADRFWPKVAKADIGCWEWLAYREPRGYGKIGRPGKHGGCTWAHIVSYELAYGPVPAGLELDHLCNNKGCVRPDHLEPVTHAENLRRAAQRQLRCKNGHRMVEGNLYEYAYGRMCRTCALARAAVRNKR